MMQEVIKKTVILRRTPTGAWSVRMRARCGDVWTSAGASFRREREAKAWLAQRLRTFTRLCREMEAAA